MHAMVHWWADASCYVGNVAPLSQCSCSKPYRFVFKQSCLHSLTTLLSYPNLFTNTETHWSEQPTQWWGCRVRVSLASIHGLPAWFGSQCGHRISLLPVGMAAIDTYVWLLPAFRSCLWSIFPSWEPPGPNHCPLTQGSGKAAFRLIPS